MALDTLYYDYVLEILLYGPSGRFDAEFVGTEQQVKDWLHSRSDQWFDQFDPSHVDDLLTVSWISYDKHQKVLSYAS